MDNATLERLMIDEALGALTPDVSELLAAHTQSAGEAELKNWRRVARLASEAMEVSKSQALPAFPFRAARAARLWSVARLGLAAAAVLAIGIGIGLRIPTQPPTERVVAQAPTPQPPQRTMAVHDFWSSDRLLAVAQETEQQTPTGTAWTWAMIESQLHGAK